MPTPSGRVWLLSSASSDELQSVTDSTTCFHHVSWWNYSHGLEYRLSEYGSTLRDTPIGSTECNVQCDSEYGMDCHGTTYLSYSSPSYSSTVVPTLPSRRPWWGTSDCSNSSTPPSGKRTQLLNLLRGTSHHTSLRLKYLSRYHLGKMLYQQVLRVAI